jgi:hypothetical protein
MYSIDSSKDSIFAIWKEQLQVKMNVNIVDYHLGYQMGCTDEPDQENAKWRTLSFKGLCVKYSWSLYLESVKTKVS